MRRSRRCGRPSSQLTGGRAALARRARSSVLDEPTSSLTHEDFETLRRGDRPAEGTGRRRHLRLAPTGRSPRPVRSGHGDAGRTAGAGRCRSRRPASNPWPHGRRGRIRRPNAPTGSIRGWHGSIDCACKDSAKGAFESVDLRVRAGEIVRPRWVARLRSPRARRRRSMASVHSRPARWSSRASARQPITHERRPAPGSGSSRRTTRPGAGGYLGRTAQPRLGAISRGRPITA